MFKPEDKTQIIYLFDRYNNGWTIRFSTIDDALKFIASKGKSHNSNDYYFFKEISLSDDMYRFEEYYQYYDEDLSRYIYSSDVRYYSRRYTFIDGTNRTLDLRNYLDKIDSFYESKEFNYDYYPKKRRRKDSSNVHNFEFRKAPVPRTGKYGHKYYLRAVRTTNEIRLNSIPEHQPFVRPSRRPHNLPNLYDDIWRDYHSKSWKDCTKKRKQWM